ncbi:MULTISPECIES: VOC family protein [Pseudomonas]|jgi:catechol 2,3-dioxygenase-like lactoylglutathione lyase family enzyme|uniref:VOC family protein n=1 Tax=Pseudomonas TaxID=286 RepID=UPI0005FB64BF|nr:MULTISPECIES: VOC family protein [Pseudomonas]KJZ53869.1 glyoxalase [Pseudomonas marginalis]KJZ58597.1 glyoxalase [Pseudomonas marginalis]WPN21607.1 VOC family protein [Pseudomonas marginalis]SFU36807.1 Catechol-2,3-dioxygenase [Pseudomonas sp. OV546]
MQTLQTSTPARLCYLHLASKAPHQQVDFYRRLLDMEGLAQADGSWLLQGPQRAMLISPADHSGLLAAAYDLGSQARLSELRTHLVGKGCSLEALDSPLLETGAFQIRDPQGRQTVFGVSRGAVTTDRKGMPGRLQHVVFQTTELEAMIDFYVNTVGFTVSDNVVDEQSGQLTTCFLRSDDEHHSLAFFRGSKNEWDHHCYETNEWNDIRDWGDRFAKERITLFFGPGRHGPGNNLFFMVVDADRNRLEFSAELEITEASRAPGVWPQEEYTLNSWGRAWIRS